jgi:hypothetical protein
MAQGAINIAAGQARLINTTVRAAGAELAVSASMALAESAIEARLTLSRPAGASLASAGAGRPEIQVTLKGPIDTPRRTLDVATLANWLTMRSVELRAQQVDALETVPDDPGEVTRSTAPSVYAPASTTTQPVRPAPLPESPGVTPRPRPAATPGPTVEPRPPARAGAGPAAQAPPTENAPTSPPRVQTPPARSDTAPRPSQAPKTGANPPGQPRSLLPKLFGGP